MTEECGDGGCENQKNRSEDAMRLRRVANPKDWFVAATKRAHAIEHLPDAIIEAVCSARMGSRHNHLDKLMKYVDTAPCGQQGRSNFVVQAS